MKDIIKFNEILFKCKVLNVSFKNYLKNAKHNWVILENGESVLRFQDGEYVAYGSKEGAIDDAMKDDKIVREDVFLKSCFKYWQVEKDGKVISPVGDFSFMVFGDKAEATMYAASKNAAVIEYSFEDIEEPTFIGVSNHHYYSTPTQED